MDGTGTLATEDRFKADEPSSSTSQEAADGTASSAVPINENLFLEEDLDGLDEELEDLELND